MTSYNHPIKCRAGGQPAARRDRSRGRRGAYIAPGASGPPPPSVQVVPVSSHDGFNRGDAGIRAAGGVGIAMPATGGGLLAVRVRRDHLDPATR
jgi:hypothetical protein